MVSPFLGSSLWFDARALNSTPCVVRPRYPWRLDCRHGSSSIFKSPRHANRSRPWCVSRLQPACTLTLVPRGSLLSARFAVCTGSLPVRRAAPRSFEVCCQNTSASDAFAQQQPAIQIGLGGENLEELVVRIRVRIGLSTSSELRPQPQACYPLKLCDEYHKRHPNAIMRKYFTITLQ